MNPELINLLNQSPPFIAIVFLWLIMDKRQSSREEVWRQFMREQEQRHEAAVRELGERWQSFLAEGRERNMASQQQLIAETANTRHIVNSLAEAMSVHHAMTQDAVEQMRETRRKSQKVAA